MSHPISFRDIISGFKQFEVGYQPVLAWAWLPAVGEVRGGAVTFLGGFLTAFEDLVMPAFTYRTILIPETGPEDNGVQYGSGKTCNEMAEMFHPDMPVDPEIGEVAELLRKHPHSYRSKHPILSFSGINQDIALQSQTMEEPLRPIGMLVEQDGWVLMVGTDPQMNTCIHYAELLVGRRTFIRWALSRNGIQECPGIPGCSRGFGQVSDLLAGITKQVQIGNTLAQGIRLQPMMEVLTAYLRKDPQGLLCSDPECLECGAVRKSHGNGLL